MVIILTAIAVSVNGEVIKPDTADNAAIVNGAPIDRKEFNGEILRIQKALLGFGRPLTCKQMETVQTDVLESLIRREILYQESVNLGIKPDEDGVKKEINALRQQFSNETEFRNELRKKNISEEILRFRLEKNSAIQQYILKQFAPDITVSDNDMTAYYQMNLDIFKQPLQVRVSHILIRSDQQGDASKNQEARKKCEQILKRLKKGEDFPALAREHSDGPTRTEGGDLGYIKTGQLDKQFESQVFALKTGEITDVIETDYGFHIFMLNDRKPETILAYEDVKEKIRQFITEEKAKQEAELYAKTLRQKAVVKIIQAEQIEGRDK
jgi:peptidyl-prolyl cis-trans isomerase C